MNCMTSVRNLFPLLLLFGMAVAAPAAAQQAEAPAPQEVWFGEEVAVTYAARIEGDWLVVEARHEPGWHTYAMDNVERAREATGRDRPDTELPTRMTPSPEIELASPWRQTVPADLSQPDIRWYTWGFEGRSFFAARVVRADAGGWVQVDAQACTDRLCAMVDALPVPVTRSGERSVDPQTLAAVGAARRAEDAAEGLREQLAVFGDWFQRSMDLECSGRVPVARLVEIMDPGRHRPRQMNWVMALDADADGFVEPGEVGAGLWENLEHQVERRMHGDVDGDDALSPREYALFVPDPGAQTNEEHVSDRQEDYFAALDRDGDRLVSRKEIADDFVRGYIGRHWGRTVSFHLGRADVDGDGAVDRQEMAAAIEAADGSVAPEALDVWFEITADGTAGASAARLVLAELPSALTEVGGSADGRAMLEAPLRTLLTPSCGP